MLRDSKGTVFEGGVRVPAAVWWPGVIESNGRQTHPMHLADILPTLADFAEVSLPVLDGQSLKDIWLSDNKRSRKPLVIGSLGSEAMIDWPYKVVRLVSLPVIPGIFKTETWYLFNIEMDPGEENDLADADPERLNAMRDALLALSRPRAIELVTDKKWDEFGGEIVREPWAESASE